MNAESIIIAWSIHLYEIIIAYSNHLYFILAFWTKTVFTGSTSPPVLVLPNPGAPRVPVAWCRGGELLIGRGALFLIRLLYRWCLFSSDQFPHVQWWIPCVCVCMHMFAVYSVRMLRIVLCTVGSSLLTTLCFLLLAYVSYQIASFCLSYSVWSCC